jgi:hypothetical protein
MLFRMTAAPAVIVVLAVTLLGACEGPLGPQGPHGETLDWSDTIENSNLLNAAYAIGIMHRDPAAGFVIVGSGFSAHYQNMIWTNAHVAEGLRELVAEFPDDFSPDAMVAVRNGTVIGGPHTYQLDLSESLMHPEYDPEVFDSPDLAAFRVEAELTGAPALLPRALVTELRVGQPVGTFGFPGELADPETAVPIATFKDGTISALRPYSALTENITPENSLVVQHNLDSSGGTSGSAIFDHNGFIVAVNYGGAVTVIGDPEDAPEDVVIIPTGNLGFAIRVDEVWRLVDLIDAGALPAEVATPATGPVHGPYRGFPENWNGNTRFSSVPGRVSAAVP